MSELKRGEWIKQFFPEIYERLGINWENVVCFLLGVVLTLAFLL